MKEKVEQRLFKFPDESIGKFNINHAFFYIQPLFIYTTDIIDTGEWVEYKIEKV